MYWHINFEVFHWIFSLVKEYCCATRKLLDSFPWRKGFLLYEMNISSFADRSRDLCSYPAFPVLHIVIIKLSWETGKGCSGNSQI